MSCELRVASCESKKWQRVILLSTLYSLLLTSFAFAHKVNVFAYVEGDMVYTESYFSDGRKVEGGVVEIYDSQENKLLEGKTDEEGQFNFKPPKKDDLKIVLVASMGHKNSYTLSADELPEVGGQKSEVTCLPARQGSQKLEKEVSQKETVQIDLDRIKQIIDVSLDERLRPIIKELRRQEETTSLREIIAGIGYIFGIFGIVLYFLSRKRKD